MLRPLLFADNIICPGEEGGGVNTSFMRIGTLICAVCPYGFTQLPYIRPSSVANTIAVRPMKRATICTAGPIARSGVSRLYLWCHELLPPNNLPFRVRGSLGQTNKSSAVDACIKHLIAAPCQKRSCLYFKWDQRMPERWYNQQNFLR